MMDHARHLSSPSPTSPFLFHHSDRSFKSAPLTPLLSSAADAGSVDDCFSATSSSIDHQNHNPFVDDHQQEHSPLVDNQTHNHNQQNHHQRHKDQDSLTGVNDDDDDDDDVDEDGMHQMLSGSSTSSTSTMPLLTEAHSHHSFSRISLEEYSPLSLVEDCDNALPMSPTSLACGSHHSFKSSSLNVSKIDNLVGDNGLHDHEVHDDARSLSPSLINASSANLNNNNNLWSYSSTAISQNPALLNSTTSTAFLLSQHHHQQQLNSLIQQLEPQSLDEAPPLVNFSANIDSTSINEANVNRPSSEPPPGVEVPKLDCNKSLDRSQLQLKTKQQAVVKSGKATSLSESTATSSSPPTSVGPPRRIRNRSKPNPKQQTNSSSGSKNLSRVKPAATPSSTISVAVTSSSVANGSHDAKLHLQLNHHEKLKELQERLFGTPFVSSQSQTQAQPIESANQAPSKTKISPDKLSSTTKPSGQEPDSSAANSGISSEPSLAQVNSKTSKTLSAKPKKSRKSKLKTSETIDKASKGSNSSSKISIQTTSEPDEPDTTTRSSDCVKLADLLSSSATLIPSLTQDSQAKLHVNGFSSANGEINDNDHANGDRKMQQIQVQLSPSLTVVTNGGLIQPINVQQQQVNGSLITTNGQTAFKNHIFCRPQHSITANGQLKGSLGTNSDQKSGEGAITTGWSIQPNNLHGQNGQISNNNAQTLGAHHIAIQVICQDGTSLVLPVSSSTALNTAVSLGSAQPQLQAVLTNGANTNGNQQRNQNQLLPLVSVSNLVSQQQQLQNARNQSSDNKTNTGSSNQNSSSASCCGLAASSPTLAALLDAGTGCNAGELTSITNSSGQNLVSTNLLRKIVANGTGDSRKSELTIQQSCPTISLSTSASMVTVRAPNLNKNSNGMAAIVAGPADKRIKLEQSDISGIQNNFTLIDPQGIVVEKLTNDATKVAQVASGVSANVVSKPAAKTNKDSPRLGKVASSTGNRQVDPAQPFRCEHCNSTFTRLGNFTRHKKIHTVPTKDGQRFKCDFCSKSFLQRCDLARHLHIHRGTEPHRCNICGKGYIRHSDLVTHQRFHNKEKPFGCPHCSKGFCQKGDLNRHLRSIHLQMKPILCPYCNRKFAKQETLLRHLNTAHRSKPANGTGTGNELATNFNSLQQGDLKQASPSTIAFVNSNVASGSNLTSCSATSNSNDNSVQKPANPASSSQTIQETEKK